MSLIDVELLLTSTLGRNLLGSRSIVRRAFKALRKCSGETIEPERLERPEWGEIA